jgi:hypothetical protein
VSSAAAKFIWCSKCSSFIPASLYAPDKIAPLLRYARGDKRNFERVRLLAHACHIYSLARRG